MTINYAGHIQSHDHSSAADGQTLNAPTVASFTSMLASGGTPAFGSLHTFFRNSIANAPSAAMFIKNLQAGGGGAGVIPLVGLYMTADVTGGTFNATDHAIGGLGYMQMLAGSIAGAGYYGLEGRCDLVLDQAAPLPQGWGVLGLGVLNKVTPANLQGVTGVEGRIELGAGVTGTANHIAIAGRFSVVPGAGVGVGAMNAWNAIFGDGAVLGFRTEFRGLVQAAQGTLDILILDNATPLLRAAQFSIPVGDPVNSFEFKFREAAGANEFRVVDSASVKRFNVDSLGNVNIGLALVALGGGAAPTFGTIGGTGPAAAAQNGWFKFSVLGVATYIPVWR